MPRIAEEFQTHRRESDLERVTGPAVAPESLLESFIQDQQRFAQRVGHAGGQSVVNPRAAARAIISPG
ncbi:MAG: hypothetical protein ACRDGN_08230 [bacterium]